MEVPPKFQVCWYSPVKSCTWTLSPHCEGLPLSSFSAARTIVVEVSYWLMKAYERMGGPKRLVWLDTTQHIDLYDAEPFVCQAVEAVVAFLGEHL